MTTVYARLQVRRDTAANWEAENPVLREGEIGFVTDTKSEKIGDGVTAWNDLLTRPSQEQLLAVQDAAELAAGDAQQRLEGAVAAQGAAETARDETRALRDETYGYKADVASAIVYQDLASIAASKGLAMVAGCIDTSPIPLSAQIGTSWYRTLGRMPATRVIIAEADTFTILDGDDPSLPIWWQFTIATAGYTAWSQISSILGDSTASDTVAVDARNGKFFVGREYPSTDGARVMGVFILDFLNDRATNYSDSGMRVWPGAVTDTGLKKWIMVNAGKTLAVGPVTSLDVTVRPDAPVDPATGVQVPTIAVGSDGGMSVINNDGTISNTPGPCNCVHYVGDYLLRQVAGDDDPVHVYDARGETKLGEIHRSDGGVKFPQWLASNAPIAIAGEAAKSIAGAHLSSNAKGVEFLALDPSNLTGSGTSMIAIAAASFASGWMQGDIRGAWLASTDQTDLTASGELVTNGTFDADVSGWDEYDPARGTISWQNGKIRLANDGSGNTFASQAIATEIGKTYVLSGTVTSAGTTYGRLQAGASVGSATFGYKQANANSTAFVQLSFVATSTTSYVQLSATGVGGDAANYAEFDNLSVQLADGDRSSKKNGFIVHGTVGRTPVATGAELVSYGPFGTGSFLEQPHNADLDVGTGDFCVMGWVKSSVGPRYFFDRSDAQYQGSRISLYRSSVGNIRATVTGSAELNSGVDLTDWWQFVCLRRKNGVLYLSVDDGAAVSVANTNNLTNASAVSRLGLSVAGTTPGQYLALWRFAASAPSAAQVAMIRNIEKFWFGEDASITIGGTSSEIRDLAFDEVTGIYHVLTADGETQIDSRTMLRVGFEAGDWNKIAAHGGMVLKG